MPLNFNNSQGFTTISAPPRVVTVYDPVSGCPNGSRTSPLLTATIAVARPAYFFVSSSMIRTISGRTDLQMNVQGPAGSNYPSSTTLSTRLNWTSTSTWDNVVCDIGFYGNTAGTYSITLNASSPGVWGCGRQWGKMFVTVFEV